MLGNGNIETRAVCGWDNGVSEQTKYLNRSGQQLGKKSETLQKADYVVE